LTVHGVLPILVYVTTTQLPAKEHTMATIQTAQDLEGALHDALTGVEYGDDHEDIGAELANAFEGVRARSFEEEGVLTRDAGLVVKVGDAEYQITIVRSR
jgi:hypothetical protein